MHGGGRERNVRAEELVNTGGKWRENKGNSQTRDRKRKQEIEGEKVWVKEARKTIKVEEIEKAK